MEDVQDAATQFLFNKRVAVTEVSRNPKSHGSKIVYQRLRARGYDVFAVNPNADEVEGDTCFHDLKPIPGGVDAVVIGTRTETAESTMRECAELGIAVIDGGCPLMFEPTADSGHKAMRFVCTMTGKVPRRV